MRRLVSEGGPFFLVACVLLGAGVAVVVAGRAADSTPTMGVGLALLLLAVAAIQLVARRRNRLFEAEMSSMHEVINQARSRRGELPADEDDQDR